MRLPIFLATISLILAIASIMSIPKSVTNRIFHPGYGCCMRCHRTWDVVEGHSTPYQWYDFGDGTMHPSKSCFPLCEECWKVLTPEERLPYYRRLLDGWEMEEFRGGYPTPKERWDNLRESVLRGE